MVHSFYNVIIVIRSLLNEERRRWILWWPVGLGIGIACYFALPFELPLWPGLLLSGGMVIGLLLCSRESRFFIIQLVILSIILGFIIAQLRTWQIDAPRLDRPMGATITGRILDIDDHPKGYRLLLGAVSIVGLEPHRTPLYSRIVVRTSERTPDLPPPIGSVITVRGRLWPPASPSAPGAFDFQRYAFFRQLGAVGITFNEPQILEDPASDQALSVHIARLRVAIETEISSVVSQPASAIMVALMVGDRSGIRQDVREAFRHSGLAHLLAISGLHTTLIAGIVFFFIRAMLAAWPWLTLRYPIKKWAAGIGLLAALGYMIIGGTSIPTVRAALMTGMVMLAIMLDRHPFSMRLLAIAATIILMIRPESLLSASFQMSFAAVMALVAFYDPRNQWSSSKLTRAKHHWFLAPFFYIGALALTAVIATLATMPFVMFHFGHIVLVGPLSNLLAMPVMAFWIMPCMVLSYVLMPFGLDLVPLTLMSWGVEIVIEVAQWSSSLSGATLPTHATSIQTLILFTVAGLWLCLWQQSWRWLGILPGIIAVIVHMQMPVADLLISDDGKWMAVQTHSGRLSFSNTRTLNYDAKAWLQRHGVRDPASPWPDLGRSEDGSLQCDQQGCLYHRQGHRVALVRMPDALAEDCRTADILIAPFRVYRCPVGILIDLDALRREGAHAIYLTEGTEPYVVTVNGWRGDRPWSINP